MQLFIIGPEGKKELAKVKANAESNPFSAEATRARVMGGWQRPDDLPLFTCYLPVDYKVVYTIEAALSAANWNEAHGMCRHLSMSIGRREKTPHPAVCQEVMNELGFVNTLDSGKCYVWIEKEAIINIMEII
jgi:hypothetical protein